MAIVQVYNPRSKKWVKMDDEKKGGIIDMQSEKFDDIPVKNGTKKNQKSKHNDPEKTEKEYNKKQDKEKSFWGGLFGK